MGSRGLEPPAFGYLRSRTSSSHVLKYSY